MNCRADAYLSKIKENEMITSCFTTKYIQPVLQLVVMKSPDSLLVTYKKHNVSLKGMQQV